MSARVTHILVSKNGGWGDIVRDLATLYEAEVREVDDCHLDFPTPVPNLNPDEDSFNDGHFLKVGKRDPALTAAVISERDTGAGMGHTLLYREESQGMSPEDAVALYCRQINCHLGMIEEIKQEI